MMVLATAAFMAAGAMPASGQPEDVPTQPTWSTEGALEDDSTQTERAVVFDAAGTRFRLALAPPYTGSTITLVLSHPSGPLGDANASLLFRLRAGHEAVVVLAETTVFVGNTTQQPGHWDGEDTYGFSLPPHLGRYAVRPLELAVDGVAAGTWWIPTGTENSGNLWASRYVAPPDAEDPETKENPPTRYPPAGPWKEPMTRYDGDPGQEGDLWVSYSGARATELLSLTVSWSYGTGRLDGTQLHTLDGLAPQRLGDWTWPLPETARDVLVQIVFEDGLVESALFSFDDEGRLVGDEFGEYVPPEPAVGLFWGLVPIILGLAGGAGVAIWALRRER